MLEQIKFTIMAFGLPHGVVILPMGQAAEAPIKRWVKSAPLSIALPPCLATLRPKVMPRVIHAGYWVPVSQVYAASWDATRRTFIEFLALTARLGDAVFANPAALPEPTGLRGVSGKVWKAQCAKLKARKGGKMPKAKMPKALCECIMFEDTMAICFW